jgi:hypothetical protein
MAVFLSVSFVVAVWAMELEQKVKRTLAVAVRIRPRESKSGC